MKELIACSHCKREIKWYKNFIHETNFINVDEKYYCDECLRKLGHKAIENG